MGIKNLVRAILIGAYRRVVRPLFGALPVRWSFAALVLASAARFPDRFVLATTTMFVPVATREMVKDPKTRFSSAITDFFPTHSAQTLLWIGACEEGTDVLIRRTQAAPERASILMARLWFEQAEFERAHASLLFQPSSAQLVYKQGLLELLIGSERAAIPLLVSAAQDSPYLMCPHQNLAARSPRGYVPNPVDLGAGIQGRLYDGYNYLGQRVTHVGAGHLGPRLFAGAMRAQQKLQRLQPKLSAGLETLLADLDIPLDELRVLPPEWVTQIGHQGMLDILFRMRELGWWKGRPVLLAPRSKVANQAMLALFKDNCPVFAFDGDHPPGLLAELSSLQRYYGMSFNVFDLPGGNLVPWQDAGAMLMRQWEAEGRGYPLRDSYDRYIGALDRVQADVENAKQRWGMEPTDWYVCLHLRDPSHYNEAEGSGQTHRNASVESYLPAIEHITRQGGWVIKLGGPRSPKLPKMERVIDYARSPLKLKSEVLDLHLIRHARYFIGTTSGLTNVAVSFGVPSALVNCITVDAQLWGDRVRFALKPVIRRDGGMLTQRELTSSPWRWRVFGAAVMLRHGVTPLQNTPDEVLETAKEVESLADGVPVAPEYSAGDPDSLIEAWQGCLDVPYFYGNARPSLYYLDKYRLEFLRH